jgi:hypothetical protein
MVKSRNILPPKRFWTEAEEELLRQCYADALTADLAVVLDMPARRILAKANAMGLKKSIELIAETARQRTMQPGHGSQRTRIRPGQEPWNKGKPGVTGTQEACRATQFKPGSRPHTWLPVGSYRVVPDGTLEQKVNDLPGPNTVRWKPVARLVWESANGPVPSGHAVVFRRGMKTTNPDLVTLDRLQLVTRVELMRQNSYHTNMPPELARLVQLRGVLSRAINTKAKKAQSHE